MNFIECVKIIIYDTLKKIFCSISNDLHTLLVPTRIVKKFVSNISSFFNGPVLSINFSSCITSSERVNCWQNLS